MGRTVTRTDADDWLTVVEAAELLGMAPNTAYRLLRTDKFPVPAYRLSRYWRIPRRPIERLLGRVDDEAAS